MSAIIAVANGLIDQGRKLARLVFFYACLLVGAVSRKDLLAAFSAKMPRRRAGRRTRKTTAEIAADNPIERYSGDCSAKVQLWLKAELFLGGGAGGVRNLYRHLTIWKALLDFQRRSGFSYKRRVKRVSWHDEDPGPGAEARDPAVLALGPAVREPPALRYERQRLLDMRCLPLSKRRPRCLDNPDYAGLWIVKKRSDSPLDEDRGRDIPGDVPKRRAADPRERVRKESSPGPAGGAAGGALGVVLSPQRRSFTSGCYVPPSAALAPLGPPHQNKGDPGFAANSREQRRIGSGRILQRDMTTVPWERGAGGNQNANGNEDQANDFNQQPYRPPNSIMRDRNDDRYERRSYGRDSYSIDNKRDKEMDRFTDRRDRDDNRRNRYNDRRRNYNNDDEPEWFSGGPTSQLDTIELRGFDEPSPATNTANKKVVNGKDSSRDKSSNSVSASDSSAMKSLDVSTVSGGNSHSGVTVGSGTSPEPAHPPARSTPTPRVPHEGHTGDDNHPSKTESNQERNGLNEQRITGGGLNDDIVPEFVFEDFLKYDNIPGLLSNGSIDDTSHRSSRFSQWFTRDSPPPASQQDSVHERVISLIDEIDQSISIPTSEDKHLFAPISPAASSSRPTPNLQASSAAASQAERQAQSGALFDMLQRNQQPQNKEQGPSKMHSLEELEARMRARAGSGRIPPSQLTASAALLDAAHPLGPPPGQGAPQRDDDKIAFKRLLAQVSGGHSAPTSNGPVNQHKQPPMSLLQMLNKSQQADQQALEQQRQQLQQQQQQQAHIPQELLYRLLHLQQNQRQHDGPKVMPVPPNRHFQGSPIPGDLQSAMNNVQVSKELLNRPEAQAIIHGLKRGELTLQNLVQQISNPGMQSRHREVLLSILKVYQQSRAASPPPPQPHSHLMLASHQQQLRVSPLPNAYCVSPIMATSPNTLAIHHPAYPPRIPSPRELQIHTQNIMHGALLKRKMEEAEQKFRRKQEAAGGGGSAAAAAAPSGSPSRQPPLAFTPTSVLRKMTAEKDGESNGSTMIKPQQSWPLQTPQPKMPQGRPIVKGNQSGISGAGNAYQQSSNQDFQSQAYINHHQQQRYNMTPLQQQQLQLAARGNQTASGSQQSAFPSQIMMQQMQQQQQRQSAHSMQSQMNSRSANSGQSSLQQLLMQAQHGRNYNEGQSGGGGSRALSPTSNQLARWFSPELLARATAGKLPPVNLAANALSLEELERIQHGHTTVHN